MLHRTIATALVLAIVPVQAFAQRRNSQGPAVFPPLTDRQQAEKQALLDSIQVSDDKHRPNIVLIFADDLGYADIGCFGSSDIPTPHIDSLASGGMKFTNAYVTAGTCSPSRAGLLTGQYQQRFGFEFNTSSRAITERLGRGLDPSAITIADVMRKAGYATGMVGKWHQGTREQYHPLSRGFDSFYGFLAGGHTYIAPDRLSKEEIAIGGGGVGATSPMLRGFQDEVEEEYLTDAFAREAVKFIHQQSKDRPFFLYVPFNAVHTPLQASEKYKSRFPHITDLKRRVYYAMTSALDDAVGRIVGAIDDQGFSDNTIVVFFNDNGGPLYTGVQSNSPLRLGKLFLFEGGVRVPLIVKWPAVVKPESVCDGIVSALDMFPTFSRVAGVTLPSSLKPDGVDLRPWFAGERTDSPHETLFWRNGENKSMRKGKWKMIQVPTHVWLFDLDEDIGEQNNLAEQYPDVVREMQREYRAWESTIRNPAWPAKPNRPTEIIDGIEYRINV